MNKITKTEFISALMENPSILCNVSVRSEVIYADLAASLTKINAIPTAGYDTRTVTERKSNCLVFSNGSRLYFDGKAKRIYFREGNALAVCVDEGTRMIKLMTYLVVAS